MAALSAPQLLLAARRAAGLTQAELASKLGTSQAGVARLERSGANPTIATLERALQATGHRLELGAASRKSSVDETLIESNLGLTAAERLQSFQRSHRNVAALAGKARRRGGKRRR